MDREIICPKCGARDQYEVESIFYETLIKNEYRSIPVTSIRARAFNQYMHPLEAIERYKLRILTHPRQAENYMRLGNLLRILRRSDQALAMIRQGHALEPLHPEWTLIRATAEHDLGNKQLARRYYEEVLRLTAKAHEQDQNITWFKVLANKGLKNLARGQPSVWFDLYKEELGLDEGTQPDAEVL
jgi:tetratricopeptide (TPR) repeat protein